MTKEEYVNKYLNIVTRLAYKYSKSVSSINIEAADLYQEGCLALVKAYNNLNEEDINSGSYAYNVIRYAILNYITHNSYVAKSPPHIVLSARLVSNYQADYYIKTGNNAPMEDLLAILRKTHYSDCKIDEEYVNNLKIYNNIFFYSQIFSLEHFMEVEEEPIYDYDLEGEVINKVTIQEIMKLFCLLPDIEKDIIIKTIGLGNEIPLTRRDLAKEYNMSPQGIDLRYHKGLNKIKSKIKK